MASRRRAPALGYARRDFLRNWPFSSRTWHLGFGSHRSSVVASGTLDCTRLAALGGSSCALAAVLVGIPAATRVARASGRKDPQFVVIDEVAGQLVTLIAAPVAWQSLLLGFILFRAFDIVKPPPVRQLERLPEGAGIVVDDVGAGLYGLAVMQIVLHFGLLPR